MQADVFELALVDRGQRLGHAVDERLDADEAGARMALGFARSDARRRRSRFRAARRRRRRTARADRRARASARSSASRGSSVSNSAAWRARSGWPLRRPKKAPVRFGRSAHRRHARAVAGIPTTWHSVPHKRDGPATRPGYGRLCGMKPHRVGCVYLNALLSWLARLVCSQEKPPSLSGARPKWP